MVSPPLRAADQRGSGLIFALSAHVLWGVLTLYFIALAPTTAWEIVAWRVVFALIICVLLLTVTRTWRPFVGLLRAPRILFTMALAGALIYVNWQTYVLATVTGHVVEAALGYFINPIVTILLGVLVQRERLRPAQWVAVGLSAVAVIVLALGYGAFPWIALMLAFSFGFYGLIKKRVGPAVDAVSGLTLETMWLTPIAVVQLVVVGMTTGITLGEYGVWHTIALAGAGVVTAVPLLFFAAASRRLPLVYLGFVQYITPLIQFLVGVFVLREAMPPERWLGFGMVWVALIVLSSDMIAAARAGRRRASLGVAADAKLPNDAE